MAITCYNTFNKLTVASNANIDLDDYVYETNDNTSGGVKIAEGIVHHKNSTNSITVTILSGTFTNPKTLFNQDGDTASVSAVAAGTSVPTNVVIVTGDNSSSTDIYRDIMGSLTETTDYTAPDATKHYWTIVLPILIYYGRRDQTAATIALSQNEEIHFANSALTEQRLVSNATYISTFRMGTAKYKDDNYSNFPPLKVADGSKLISSDGSGAGSIVSDLNSVLELYDSEFNGVSTNPAGTFYWNRVTFINSGLVGWGEVSTGYMEDLRLQDGSAFLPSNPPVALNKIRTMDAAQGFSFGVAFEATFEDTDFWDANGEQFDWYFSSYLAGILVNMVNSNASIRGASNIDYGGGYTLSRNTFDLSVIDENLKPIEGATVELLDKYGYNVLATNLTSATFSSSADFTDSVGVIPVIDSTGISKGDYIFATDEAILVGTVSGNNLGTVGDPCVRGQRGTSAHSQYASISIWRIATATTDSAGKIFDENGDVYLPMRAYNRVVTIIESKDDKNPFTLVIKKSGYKTYRSKFVTAEKMIHSGTDTDTSQVVTLTIASPCVVTLNNHAFELGEAIVFIDNGDTLPTGLTKGTTYYIRAIDANTFHLYNTYARAVNTSSTTGRINTSGSQSGTHLITAKFLVDSGASFTSANCPIGSLVQNITDGTYSTVNAVATANRLNLRANIMANGEAYRIYEPIEGGIKLKITLKKNRFRELKSLPN